MNELASMAAQKQKEYEKLRKCKEEGESEVDGMTKRPRENNKHRPQRSASVPAAQVNKPSDFSSFPEFSPSLL
jgi:hypothetical protein